MAILIIIFIGFVDLIKPIYFNLWQHNWKKQIRRELKEEVKKHHLIILSFAKIDLQKGNVILQFIREDEFKFNGSMYDIVEINETKDSILYTCFLDLKEMLQISALLNLFTNSGNFSPTSNLFKLRQIENIFYILVVPSISIYLTFNRLQYFTKKMSFLSFALEIPTPPPKY